MLEKLEQVIKLFAVQCFPEHRYERRKQEGPSCRIYHSPTHVLALPHLLAVAAGSWENMEELIHARVQGAGPPGNSFILGLTTSNSRTEPYARCLLSTSRLGV